MEAFVRNLVILVAVGAAGLGAGTSVPSCATPTRADADREDRAVKAPAARPPSYSVMPGVDAVARALAERITPRWEGPRVPWPEVEPRPSNAPPRVMAALRPVAVHAPPSVADARVDAALDALEIAYDALRALGLEPPYEDGRGPGSAFDLYLVPGHPSARGAPDPAFVGAALDAVTSFAVVGADVPDARLLPCVTTAYAEAILLALDPAEAAEVRHALSAYLTHRVTGIFGCGDGAIDAQAAPGRSALFGEPGNGEGGALFFAVLSDRYDGGSAAFIRAVIELSRQRTGDGGDLRALPNIPKVLTKALSQFDQSLTETIADFSVARFHPGTFDGVPAASVEWATDHASMPAHLGPPIDSVEVFGSAYARVDLRGAPAGRRIGVWLRGEHGVDWALTAVTLDAEGRPRTRVRAPSCPDPRRAFAPVELEPSSRELVVVVTNLGPSDADVPEVSDLGALARRFRLIIDEVPGDDEDARRTSTGT